MTNDNILREQIKASENCDKNVSRSKDLQPTAVCEESYAKQTLGMGSKLSGGHEKVLGLPWDTENDDFVFEFSKLADAAKKVTLTKRNLLSLLASQFDPLGWIGPIIIRMKMLFQKNLSGKH